jgi:L-ascorbate metabolism protein UlaG (beta-lactamase superfamily)
MLIVMIVGLAAAVAVGASFRKSLRRVSHNLFGPTPYHRVENKPQPKSWPDDRITVTWVGHATVLINYYGTTILTDPVMGKRIGLNPVGRATLGIHRITEPALSVEDLPPIDVVLLSHAHQDHWDFASLKQFGGHTTAVIPAGCDDLIPRNSIGNVVELDRDQDARVGGVTITAFAVNHWGSRLHVASSPDSRVAKKKRGCNGYAISGHGRLVVFVGDTANMDDFHRHVASDEPPDLCIMPIGCYSANYNHATPEQAWAMFRQARGRHMLATHWRTFMLSPEPDFEPMQRLLAACGPHSHQIICRGPGEVFSL